MTAAEPMTQPVKIAFLHTAEINERLFGAALAKAAPDARATSVLRADLLAASIAAGGMTAEIAEETAELLAGLRAAADAVLLTCSTLGPAVERLPSPLERPVVMRVDAALAELAVASAGPSGRVAVLCAVSSTLEPTRALFEAAATEVGADVEMALVAGAWDAFEAGDVAEYNRLVAAAADRAAEDGARVVALAQASMAGAAAVSRADIPVLSSPEAGLRAALAAARA